MKRKHLADGVYFRWLCEHKNGTVDRASDRNDGSAQEDCEVEIVEDPGNAHRRIVATIELAEVMSQFHSTMERVESELRRIRADLMVDKP